jgi:ferric-chelate reductase
MSGTRSFVYQPPKGLDPAVFVFHIDLLLLCLFGLYVVLTIPRALFYFFQPTDIFNGLFLRAGSQPVAHVGDPFARASTTRGTKPPIRSTSVRSNRTVSSPFDMPEDGVLKGGTWKSPSGPASPPALIVPQLSAVGLSRLHLTKRHRAPTRVPRWSTVIHPTISYVLNHRVAPGFSFGKLLVLLAYAIVMGYATLYSSDPFTDPLRAGWVCTSQIPIALALVGKTNLLSWASGVCYQKVLISSLHRVSFWASSPLIS